MSELLLTQEVGSLAKPNWRVQPVQTNTITNEHFTDAIAWAGRLDIDPQLPYDILRTAQAEPELTSESLHAIKGLSALYAVRLQEKAGLDILYDGEQDRPEMYQDAVDRTNGFEPRGRLRAFDNKSFLKSAVVETPSISTPWYVEELDRAKQATARLLKVPITGAYTLADWSFDEYYQKRSEKGGRGLPKNAARRAFVLDLAERVIRPNIASLLESGAEWIQIDEPAATTKPEEVPLFVEAFNTSVEGLVGKFSVHICFSDYNLLFPHIEQLENCAQYSLEFANRDSHELGTDATQRPAYEVLAKLRDHAPESGVGLGVTSVHDDTIEDPKVVRDRILRAVDILGDPTKVYPSPDCGLRTRSWDVALKKLETTVAGTRLAKSELA